MEKRLYLSENKKLAGVCAGIAEYLGVDPTIVRLLWLIAFFVYGSGLLLYILCWAIIPRKPFSA